MKWSQSKFEKYEKIMFGNHPRPATPITCGFDPERIARQFITGCQAEQDPIGVAKNIVSQWLNDQ